MDEMIVSILTTVFALLVFWALQQKVKELLNNRIDQQAQKHKMLNEQTLDRWFLSMMRTTSADADAVSFEYYPEDRTWVMVVGEQDGCGGGIEPLWRSRTYESITQCWKEFMLLHKEI